ncbi:MAG: methyltransferase [bacterium]
MNEARPTVGIWVGQPLHFTCMTVLIALVYFGWDLLGRPVPAAFWWAVAFPVVHQVYVWLAWRLELGSALTSKTIGFRGYVVIFFSLFACRFISLAILGWFDRGSLNLGLVSVTIFTIALAIPGIYAMYSVKRYFGMDRAAGADHFDARYRSMPLVNEGIFRFTSNGMYLYAFFLFWAIAVGFNSSAALIVVAFSHAYIWVHHYATEIPDMDFLYNPANQDM